MWITNLHETPCTVSDTLSSTLHAVSSVRAQWHTRRKHSAHNRFDLIAFTSTIIIINIVIITVRSKWPTKLEQNQWHCTCEKVESAKRSNRIQLRWWYRKESLASRMTTFKPKRLRLKFNLVCALHSNRLQVFRIKMRFCSRKKWG